MSDISLPIAGVPQLRLPARPLSDERLARLASAGSESAFAVLYERHHQALYRYCLSIVRDPDDAQDALQSALARAFAALRASGRDLAVRPWLFRIAHNESVSILRRRRPNASLVEEQVSSLVTVDRSLEERERLSTLVADLQALPVRQRAALLMRELSGLSIAEVAAALSVSPGAAKQTLFEARTSLHAFAEGRAMHCEAVRRAISDGDRRVLRGRRMRAHLRDCAGCDEFGALIDERSADLRAIAPPLPASASASVLMGLFAHGVGGGHATAAATASGAALGSHATVSLVVKGLAGIAVVAAAGVGTVRLVSGPMPHQRAPAAARPGHSGRATGGSPEVGVPSPAAARPGAPAGSAHRRRAHSAPHSSLRPRLGGSAGSSLGDSAGSFALAPGELAGASTLKASHSGAGRALGGSHRGSGSQLTARGHRSHRPAHPVHPSPSRKSKAPPTPRGPQAAGGKRREATDMGPRGGQPVPRRGPARPSPTTPPTRGLPPAEVVAVDQIWRTLKRWGWPPRWRH